MKSKMFLITSVKLTVPTVYYTIPAPQRNLRWPLIHQFIHVNSLITIFMMYIIKNNNNNMKYTNCEKNRTQDQAIRLCQYFMLLYFKLSAKSWKLQYFPINVYLNYLTGNKQCSLNSWVQHTGITMRSEKTQFKLTDLFDTKSSSQILMLVTVSMKQTSLATSSVTIYFVLAQ